MLHRSGLCIPPYWRVIHAVRALLRMSCVCPLLPASHYTVANDKPRALAKMQRFFVVKLQLKIDLNGYIPCKRRTGDFQTGSFGGPASLGLADNETEWPIFAKFASRICWLQLYKNVGACARPTLRPAFPGCHQADSDKWLPPVVRPFCFLFTQLLSFGMLAKSGWKTSPHGTAG